MEGRPPRFPKLGFHPYDDDGTLVECDHLPLVDRSDGATDAVICLEVNQQTSGMERVLRPVRDESVQPLIPRLI